MIRLYKKFTKKIKKIFTFLLVCATVCILSHEGFSDIIVLKNESLIRGYIVEKNNNSYKVKTSLGSMHLEAADISHISYEEPEANLTYLANEYLNDEKFEEAVYAYNEALKINPDYEEAQANLKRAKKQLADYKQKLSMLEEEKAKKRRKLEEKILNKYGLDLMITNNGLQIQKVLPGSIADNYGLRNKDKICAINSKSLINIDSKELYNLLEDVFNQIDSLWFYREYRLKPEKIKYQFKQVRALGIILIKKRNYISVDEVISNSPAHRAGLRENDRLKKINGVEVDNLSLQEIADISQKSQKASLLVLRCIK
jgi:C-terminal processing protease CtpA/Prc